MILLWSVRKSTPYLTYGNSACQDSLISLASVGAAAFPIGKHPRIEKSYSCLVALPENSDKLHEPSLNDPKGVGIALLRPITCIVTDFTQQIMSPVRH